MDKKRSQPNHWATVISVAVVIAALIGIAYLANNTAGGSAAPLSATVSTNPRDYTLPQSPYPECQALLDEANKKIVSDPTYRRLLDELGYWIKERQRLYNILSDPKSTAEQRRDARFRLSWIVGPKIRDAQIKVNEYHSKIFAAYDECVAEAQAKRSQKPWWQTLWPGISSNSVTKPTLTF
jgi:hypothetical protein